MPKYMPITSIDGRFQHARRILAHALPSHRVHSLKILEGGATNLNMLARFEVRDELLVLRQYLRGAEVCRKEALLYTPFKT
jgi:hypothetical protein